MPGPVTTLYESNTLYWRRERYTQPKPYRPPLPYDFRYGAINEGVVVAGAMPSHVELGRSSVNSKGIYNKAYAKLVEKLGEKASLGITLAQWKQADSMIRQRALQLLAFTSAVVRRSPTGIAQSLGLDLKRVKKTLGRRHATGKKLSDLWLEFHFGWVPIIKDVHSAIEVFSKDITLRKIKGSSEDTGLYKRVPPNQFSLGFNIPVRVQHRVGCELHLDNPNVLLGQRLGFLNPASILFDAVPFSFVADWFTDIQSVLESVTDFAGYDVRNAWTLSFTSGFGNFFWPAYPQFAQGGYGIVMLRGAHDSVPLPRIHWKGLGFKPTRGLTAITLLAQKLGSIR